MKRLLYLIAFIPSVCFSATPFFAGTAANALHANIADGLMAATTACAATGLVGGTYNYYGANPVKMNAQNAVTAGTCTGNAATATTAATATNATNATTATNSTQLNGQSASYYATQSGLNATSASTGTIYTALQSTGAALSVETANRIAGDSAVGISTGNITNNFNTFVSAVNVSTAATLATDNNQNIAIGILQNNLFAYGGQVIKGVNSSTGTSFVNVDTTTYAPGVALIFGSSLSYYTSSYWNTTVNIDTINYSPGVGLNAWNTIGSSVSYAVCISSQMLNHTPYYLQNLWYGTFPSQYYYSRQKINSPYNVIVDSVTSAYNNTTTSYVLYFEIRNSTYGVVFSSANYSNSFSTVSTYPANTLTTYPKTYLQANATYYFDTYIANAVGNPSLEFDVVGSTTPQNIYTLNIETSTDNVNFTAVPGHYLSLNIYTSTTSVMNGSYVSQPLLANSNWNNWTNFQSNDNCPPGTSINHYIITSTSTYNLATNQAFLINNNSQILSSTGPYIQIISSFSRTYGFNVPTISSQTVQYSPSGSYSTVFSSASLNIFNNGGFYTWGKFACNDNQSTVTGSSITYKVAFSTNGVDTWTAPQTIFNNTLLMANTPYMQFNEYFNRWVSTATPITNSASFNVNYSAPLINLQNYSNVINASSMTVTNVSISSGITFSDNSRQTTAYNVTSSSNNVRTDGNWQTNGSAGFQAVVGGTVTITTGGNTKVLIMLSGTCYGTLTGGAYYIDIYMDGSSVSGGAVAGIGSGTEFIGSDYIFLNFSFLTPSVVSAGTHTFQLYIQAGTGRVLLYKNSTFPFFMSAIEVR